VLAIGSIRIATDDDLALIDDHAGRTGFAAEAGGRNWVRSVKLAAVPNQTPAWGKEKPGTCDQRPGWRRWWRKEGTGRWGRGCRSSQLEGVPFQSAAWSVAAVKPVPPTC
jgi:hypothetical protein